MTRLFLLLQCNHMYHIYIIIYIYCLYLFVLSCARRRAANGCFQAKRKIAGTWMNWMNWVRLSCRRKIDSHTRLPHTRQGGGASVRWIRCRPWRIRECLVCRAAREARVENQSDGAWKPTASRMLMECNAFTSGFRHKLAQNSLKTTLNMQLAHYELLTEMIPTTDHKLKSFGGDLSAGSA